jgi:type I restriction enzyme, S subunit
MSLPRYPRYKDSTVEWLGDVPEHWEIKPLKYVASMKGRLGWQGLRSDEYTEEGPCLVTSEHFSNDRIDWQRCYHVSVERYDLAPQIQLSAGDLLMMKDGAAMGKLAFVDDLPGPACLNSHLLLFRPLNGRFENRFLYYVLGGPGFNCYMVQERTGTTFFGISQESISSFPFATPPISEQRRILDFLRREVSKIDALVGEQRRLIELLKEKRQAVISHAVTKGLNPDAPMKDSGIEWLSEVPEHWRVGKCGFYLTILSGYAFPSTGFTEEETDTKLLRGINVGVSRLRWDETVYWQRRQGDGLDAYEMGAGDIVIGMDRPVISEGVRVAKVKQSDLPCLLLQRVASLKTTERLAGDYLLRLLSSEMFTAHFSPEATGVSVPHISPDQIYNFVIPVPPVAEQEAIIGFLNSEIAKMDALTSQATHAIDLLQERRTALISAAVTGKIDVRDVAIEDAA